MNMNMRIFELYNFTLTSVLCAMVHQHSLTPRDQEVPGAKLCRYDSEKVTSLMDALELV